MGFAVLYYWLATAWLLLLVSQRLDYLFGDVDAGTAENEIAQRQDQVVLLRLRDYLNSFTGSQLKRGDFVVLAQTQVFAHLPLSALILAVEGGKVALLVAPIRFLHGLPLFFQKILKLLRLQGHPLDFLIARQEFFFYFFQGSYRGRRFSQNSLGVDNADFYIIRKRGSPAGCEDYVDCRNDSP